MFASLTKVYGSLTTTSLRIPNTPVANQRFFEMGPSSWLVDLDLGKLTLKASPPSVEVLGYDVAPEQQFCLETDIATGSYKVVMELGDDFKPVPNFVEFKEGEISLEVINPLQPVPAYTFRMDGGMRLLRLPDGFAQSPFDNINDSIQWGVDVNTDFVVDTANFNITLSDLLGQSAPLTIVDAGPWLLEGDLTLSRQAGGDVELNASFPNFEFNGSQVASLSGTITSGSELLLNGSISANAVDLVSGGRFSVEKTGGGSAGSTGRDRTSVG